MTSGENFSIRYDFNILLPYKQEVDTDSLDMPGQKKNSHFWSFFFFSLGCQKRVLFILFNYHVDHRSDSLSESITQNALLKLSSCKLPHEVDCVWPRRGWCGDFFPWVEQREHPVCLPLESVWAEQ